MATRRESIYQIRRFDRECAPAVRLLDRSYLDTGRSTLEVAAFIEIGEHPGCGARDIARLWGMDKGYLSRMIRGFEEAGLVRREPSRGDARVQALFLTEAGEARRAELADEGAQVVEDAFRGASDDELAEVADALACVLDIMGGGEGR